jgi:hypothetical protein
MHARAALIVVALAALACAPSTPSIRDIGQRALADVVVRSACIKEATGGELWGGVAAIRMRDKCVIWDPIAMAKIRARFGDSAIFGIFFHELGHLFLGHRVGSKRTQLEADAFAGCWLARTGRPIRGYLDVLESISDGRWLARRADATRLGATHCEPSQ